MTCCHTAGATSFGNNSSETPESMRLIEFNKVKNRSSLGSHGQFGNPAVTSGKISVCRRLEDSVCHTQTVALSHQYLFNNVSAERADHLSSCHLI